MGEHSSLRRIKRKFEQLDAAKGISYPEDGQFSTHVQSFCKKQCVPYSFTLVSQLPTQPVLGKRSWQNEWNFDRQSKRACLTSVSSVASFPISLDLRFLLVLGSLVPGYLSRFDEEEQVDSDGPFPWPNSSSTAVRVPCSPHPWFHCVVTIYLQSDGQRQKEDWETSLGHTHVLFCGASPFEADCSQPVGCSLFYNNVHNSAFVLKSQLLARVWIHSLLPCQGLMSFGSFFIILAYRIGIGWSKTPPNGDGWKTVELFTTVLVVMETRHNFTPGRSGIRFLMQLYGWCQKVEVLLNSGDSCCLLGSRSKVDNGGGKPRYTDQVTFKTYIILMRKVGIGWGAPAMHQRMWLLFPPTQASLARYPYHLYPDPTKTWGEFNSLSFCQLQVHSLDARLCAWLDAIKAFCLRLRSPQPKGFYLSCIHFFCLSVFHSGSGLLFRDLFQVDLPAPEDIFEHIHWLGIHVSHVHQYNLQPQIQDPLFDSFIDSFMAKNQGSRFFQHPLDVHDRNGSNWMGVGKQKYWIVDPINHVLVCKNWRYWLFWILITKGLHRTVVKLKLKHSKTRLIGVLWLSGPLSCSALDGFIPREESTMKARGDFLSASQFPLPLNWMIPKFGESIREKFAFTPKEISSQKTNELDQSSQDGFSWFLWRQSWLARVISRDKFKLHFNASFALRQIAPAFGCVTKFGPFESCPEQTWCAILHVNKFHENVSWWFFLDWRMGDTMIAPLWLLSVRKTKYVLAELSNELVLQVMSQDDGKRFPPETYVAGCGLMQVLYEVVRHSWLVCCAYLALFLIVRSTLAMLYSEMVLVQMFQVVHERIKLDPMNDVDVGSLYKSCGCKVVLTNMFSRFVFVDDVMMLVVSKTL